MTTDMRACRRGSEPALLAQHGAGICAEYALRRRDNPRHVYDWRTQLKAAVRAAVRDALAEMTQERCAYCDGDLRPGSVREEIDHFRPKSHEAFYELVCTWSNLFLVCSPCNAAKGDQWPTSEQWPEGLLLRPDGDDYEFTRYFDYDFDTNMLRPHPDASAADRHRAAVTIACLHLNEGKHVKSRRRVVEQLRRGIELDEIADLSYRFLIPLLPR